MIADCANPVLRKERPHDCPDFCEVNGHMARLCDCEIKIKYKPGANLADCANNERRLKRLKESRDTLRAHVEQREDKISIIEHEIRECTA
jgi:hypothetical protein